MTANAFFSMVNAFISECCDSLLHAVGMEVHLGSRNEETRSADDRFLPLENFPSRYQRRLFHTMVHLKDL